MSIKTRLERGRGRRRRREGAIGLIMALHDVIRRLAGLTELRDSALQAYPQTPCLGFQCVFSLREKERGRKLWRLTSVRST